MIQAGFYVLSSLAIFSALMVVFSRNPIHSVLYLIITFFAITGHYALLNAQFLAIVNFIVYAGAIMVLLLFVVMLLNLNADTEPHKSTLLKFAAVFAGGLLLVTLAAAVNATTAEIAQYNPQVAHVQTLISQVGGTDTLTTHQATMQLEAMNNIGKVKELGKVLYTDFWLPFEISSVLFLSAMVGAVLLGKKEI